MSNGKRALRPLAVVVVLLGLVAACAPLKAPPPPRVLIAGDSQARDLTDPLRFSFGAAGRASESVAQFGCGMVRGVIYRFNGAPHDAACDPVVWNAHQEWLDRFGPSIVLSTSVFELFPRVVDGDPACFPEPTVAACDALLLRLLDEKRIQFESAGATWVIMTVPPQVPGYPTPAGIGDYDARVLHLNALLFEFHRQHPSVVILDLATWVCGGPPPCPAVVDGVVLRPTDGFHYSQEGAAWVAGHVVPWILGTFS